MSAIKTIWNKIKKWWNGLSKKKKIIIIVICVAVFIISPFLPQSKTSGKVSARTAWSCAQEYVKEQLVSPSSAKFCSYSNAKITVLEDNTFRISGYVDAQNAFGAVLRKSFTITLTVTHDGALRDEYYVTSFVWN
ncbi:MAG: hypothetical protein J5760_02205 [Clostridia bacterium]|nr:hypothetical protein [Clostridia bacterium]